MDIYSQEEKEELEITCSDCGKIVSENDTVCAHCGASLVEEEVECSECGATITESAEMCPRCRTTFANLFKCPDCGGEVLENENVCPTCGCIFSESEIARAKIETPSPISDEQNETAIKHQKTIVPEYSVREFVEDGNYSVKISHRELTKSERENATNKTITFQPKQQRPLNFIELKLFERSELKNCIREILKSKENNIPEELIHCKDAFEQIFKQLEDGTTLVLSKDDTVAFALFFAYLKSQSRLNSTLENLQQKFNTFTADNK
ncbi:MAG: zinc ribbon domain-containing protein [Ignavibacteriales bacterium]|nr:zinc ribbon domain-containing protein [Ignavibacteriales bacterium]